jgi:hypothetical protein
MLVEEDGDQAQYQLWNPLLEVRIWTIERKYLEPSDDAEQTLAVV